MTSEPKHISVCVCTFKRPRFLERLLQKLGDQETAGLFTYSIVVADNDQMQSAKDVVSAFAAASKIPITYCVEPRQNIPLARNKALENTSGDFAAFIDDDEFPSHDWLLTLLRACGAYGVDGVVGPVKRYFDEEPPKWIVKRCAVCVSTVKVMSEPFVDYLHLAKLEGRWSIVNVLYEDREPAN